MHLHEIRDSDNHFTIDPVTRTIKNNSTKTTLVQFDHESEVFTFELPRYIDGHDMSLCNRIEVHYINTDSGSKQYNTGVREITDFTVSEDDENFMAWSWTVSNNGTQFAGTLAFAFRFACLTDDVVDYAWSTSPHVGINVIDSIYNAEDTIVQNIDILQQWVNKIGISVAYAEQSVTSTEPNGVNIITITLTDGTQHSFEILNGITPVRGVDYWTEEDKQEIINSILGVIPEAEEAAF